MYLGAVQRRTSQASTSAGSIQYMGATNAYKYCDLSLLRLYFRFALLQASSARRTATMTSYGDIRKIMEDVNKIRNTIQDIRKAEKQMAEVQSEVELLDLVLDRIQSAEDAILLTKQDPIQLILQRLRLSITDLTNRLGHDSNKTPLHRGFMRITWPMRKRGVAVDLERIRDLRGQLNTAATLDTHEIVKQEKIGELNNL